MDPLALHIESLIFTGNPSISFDDIKNALEDSLGTTFSDNEIAAHIESLRDKYNSDQYSVEIVEIAGGFRFMTKALYHHTIGTYLRQNTHKKLSKSALESLAIIAYKQPVTKTEIESIRGVNSDYTIQKLLEKDLIEISGRSEGPGKPLLYSTTSKFTDYFGLKTIDDLPKVKELENTDNQIGEQAPIEEEQKPVVHIIVNEEEE
ncbi:MAG: SMC-Scp complex subunit ScpB [Saprospiraceae bacterium]|nr:SMC-Scp complex subunit ScpB [Saprospiraceae bacterium]MBK8828825.1 SMC-Scp complex subunit ScpB [Saprospiraceae bacterium]MBP6539471.1 SMC-Scp complex subunit ScpB [Saprospiraceae bacterium]HQV96022.1 SMC-Scp complex subunit ScpB [Saprospiraceae bacterium]